MIRNSYYLSHVTLSLLPKKMKANRKNRGSEFATRNLACPACGTAAQRTAAQFCRVCGKHLAEDYEPLDNLRSSYNLQRKHFQFESRPIEKAQNLFEVNENPASTTAWAFAVYSLVPYLGILFCPGAILMGSIGAFKAYRRPYLGGRKASLNSILVGTIVTFVQLFLWWLLYIVPEMGR